MKDKLGLKWCRPITNIDAKKNIAKKISLLANDGDIIGAGSGSTSFLTVLSLGERVKKEKLNIIIVPTSIEIELACSAVGLTIHNSIPKDIDWCFDGADEVDNNGRLLKGRGGALFKEKLVFASSKKRYVVADESKSVDNLGENFPVPIEVDISCLENVYSKVSEMNNVIKVELRLAINKDGPVITENRRIIFDVTMKQITNDDESFLLSIPGVYSTGIFSNYNYIRISN